MSKYRVIFWSVFSCIRTIYWKTRTRNNSIFGHFSPSPNSSHYFVLATLLKRDSNTGLNSFQMLIIYAKKYNNQIGTKITPKWNIYVGYILAKFWLKNIPKFTWKHLQRTRFENRRLFTCNLIKKGSITLQTYILQVG